MKTESELSTMLNSFVFDISHAVLKSCLKTESHDVILFFKITQLSLSLSVQEDAAILPIHQH